MCSIYPNENLNFALKLAFIVFPLDPLVVSVVINLSNKLSFVSVNGQGNLICGRVSYTASAKKVHVRNI